MEDYFGNFSLRNHAKILTQNAKRRRIHIHTKLLGK